MMDVILANKLVKAIPPGAHLLLVGDVDQLPSVGAGEVLRDLLAKGTPVPHVRLTQVFRQASQSGVVTNAHRINAGSFPQVRGLDDFFLFSTEDAEEAARLTVDVVVRRIPARFGLDPRRDVQVLTPVHRGPAGAAALNGLLQEALTPTRPDRPEKRFGGRVFRVGSPRALAQAVRATGSGRRHTALAHRLRGRPRRVPGYAEGEQRHAEPAA